MMDSGGRETFSWKKDVPSQADCEAWKSKSNYAPLCTDFDRNTWEDDNVDSGYNNTDAGHICDDHYSSSDIKIDEFTQTSDGKELAVAFYPEEATTTTVKISIDLSDSFGKSICCLSFHAS